MKKLESITTPFQDLEFLKLEAPANHYIDDHAISGKLFLTNKRVLFRSYQQDEYSWPLFDPDTCKFLPSLFNTGGEFIINSSDDSRLVFEVDEIRQWKKALLAAWEVRHTKLAID